MLMPEKDFYLLAFLFSWRIILEGSWQLKNVSVLITHCYGNFIDREGLQFWRFWSMIGWPYYFGVWGEADMMVGKTTVAKRNFSTHAQTQRRG